nr:SurA N-terminal domain-containing protein [Bacillota bacterium]
MIKMRKNAGTIIVILAAVLVLAMVLPGLFQGRATQTMDKYWTTTVAVADGRKITRLEYEREFISQFQLRSQLGGVRYDLLDQLRSTVMDLVVDKELVLAQAAKDKLVLSKEAIDAAVAEQKKQISNGNEDNWKAFLNNWAFTEATFRNYVSDNTLYDTYLKMSATFPEVTEADIQAEYNIRKARNPALVYDDVKDELKNSLTYVRQRAGFQAFLTLY